MSSSSLQRRPRKLVSEINVVPYIDVMLVLLIIFMVTAPLVIQGIKVDLPQVDAELVPQEEDPPLVVTVDAEGLIYVDEFFAEDETPAPVTTGQLVAQVLAVRATRPDVKILIKGDKAVPYGKVVGVMSALKASGIPEVGLITMPLEEELEALPAPAE